MAAAEAEAQQDEARKAASTLDPSSTVNNQPVGERKNVREQATAGVGSRDDGVLAGACVWLRKCTHLIEC